MKGINKKESQITKDMQIAGSKTGERENYLKPFEIKTISSKTLDGVTELDIFPSGFQFCLTVPLSFISEIGTNTLCHRMLHTCNLHIIFIIVIYYFTDDHK